MNRPTFDAPMRRIKERGSFSPVLIELIVVILFFALSMSVIVRVISAANIVSDRSAFESQALLSLESSLERAKNDPVGDGAFDQSNARTYYETAESGLIVRVVVLCETNGSAGALYRITAQAAGANGALYTLETARYLPGTEVRP